MSAAHDVAARRLQVTAVNRRRWAVLLDLAVAVAICVLGYFYAAPWFRTYEAIGAVAVMRLFGVDAVSDAVPEQILIFRPGGEVLAGVVTTSCSALLTVVGLTALASAVMRSRRLYALLGLVVAVAAVLVANNVRLVLSALAGLWWGRAALTLFHDWIGTFWALAATLLGFLLMVYVALPTAHRAEQDVAGRHTARRPASWARPGLGYRAAEAQAVNARPSTIVRLTHRYLLPRWASRRLAARREAGRIDYRIGHMSAGERMDAVRRLAADGLGAHTASLLAVAHYDDHVEVLDTLAEAVAARQWEPVTNDRVSGLRLWAHGWLLGRRLRRDGEDGLLSSLPDRPTTPGLPVVPDDDGTFLIRTPRPRPPLPRRTPQSHPRPTPATFARPISEGPAARCEDSE